MMLMMVHNDNNDGFLCRGVAMVGVHGSDYLLAGRPETLNLVFVADALDNFNGVIWKVV